MLELLNSDFETLQVIGTNSFLSDLKYKGDVIEVSEKELASLGEVQTNNTAMAIAKMRPNVAFSLPDNAFALLLDDIRDPGNLGTIIRTADWYGIQHVVASMETADFYNPKVIRSTMGSFARVSIFYTELPAYLADTHHRVFGAYLDGKDIHQVSFGQGGLIIIGNESHGISANLDQYVSDKITIPKFGKAESLNAAIATAVICDNIKRSGR